MSDLVDEPDIFDDEPGEQPYPPEDIPLDRGVITTPYDAPVRTLLDEIKERTLIVNPQFQRQSVWKTDRQSKLIESLLLNIPVPVLYFAEDDDGTRVVVDGQQRLRSVEEFHAGAYRLTGLEVLSDLNGKRWADLSPKQARTILSRTLRCVVISASSPATLRFEMFERLNTGGVPLNDQELRNCIYGGPLNDLLDEIVRTPEWLGALDVRAPDVRLRHHELVLRFFALDETLHNYRPPLKRVLNDYMRRNRRQSADELRALRGKFMVALENVQIVFGGNLFRRARRQGAAWEAILNRAVFDVQMLGFDTASRDDVTQHSDAIHQRFRDLCITNELFSRATTSSTADRRNLYARLRIWGDALVDDGITPPYLQRLPQ